MLYKDFKPSQFDSHIELEEDRENWLVVPCSHTRDSGCLDESNFHSALKRLGGESDKVEVHRFNHWGPGWFEIILVHPSLTYLVKEMEQDLEGYPILDEWDYSERETQAEDEAWEAFGAEEVSQALGKHFGLQDTTLAWLQGREGELFGLYQQYTSGTEHTETEVIFPLSWIEGLSREEMADWIKKVRKEGK